LLKPACRCCLQEVWNFIRVMGVPYNVLHEKVGRMGVWSKP
jgi:hypothetical protein